MNNCADVIAEGNEKNSLIGKYSYTNADISTSRREDISYLY